MVAGLSGDRKRARSLCPLMSIIANYSAILGKLQAILTNFPRFQSNFHGEGLHSMIS